MGVNRLSADAGEAGRVQFACAPSGLLTFWRPVPPAEAEGYYPSAPPGRRLTHAFRRARGGGDIILVVRVWLAIVLLGSLLASVGPVTSEQLKDREKNALELPPNMKDEDEDVAEETTYVFNPIQAKREVKVGRFYEKKGNHRAAAGRYLEATRWNPSFVEAYWRLGRAREKMSQGQQALDAYRTYLELDPQRRQEQRGSQEGRCARENRNRPGCGRRGSGGGRAVTAWGVDSPTPFQGSNRFMAAYPRLRPGAIILRPLWGERRSGRR